MPRDLCGVCYLSARAVLRRSEHVGRAREAEITILRVSDRFTVGKVLLTVDTVRANPRVTFER